MNICLVPKRLHLFRNCLKRKLAALPLPRIIVNSNRRMKRICPARLLITRSVLISLPLCYVSSLTTGVFRLTA